MPYKQSNKHYYNGNSTNICKVMIFAVILPPHVILFSSKCYYRRLNGNHMSTGIRSCFSNDWSCYVNPAKSIFVTGFL